MIQGLIAGGYGALVRAREGAEDDTESGASDIDAREVGPADVVMGIATSGGTPYVRAALERARVAGAATVFLCCTPIEPEDAEADVVITPLVGPEVVTGSTRMKAGTATKLVLNTITTSAMVLLGKTYGNLMVDLQVTCDKLRDRARRIIVETTGAGYEDAGRIIEAAGGSVKLGIVMKRKGVDRGEAERILEGVGGSVARALASES
jgi:N-acetylmuramic acid 6-phosphate etherase